MGRLDADAITRQSPDDDYPSPESQTGWRWLRSADEIRALGGMDPEQLQRACEYNARFDASAAVVIIRNGYLVAEWYENSARTTTRYDIWSCTKSFTGTAYGILFDDCRQGKLPPDRTIDLDSPAYAFIPEGHPLTDSRKERITFRHLLTMTSGIPGERHGIAARFRPKLASGPSKRRSASRRQKRVAGRAVDGPASWPPNRARSGITATRRWHICPCRSFT